jgi:hypothetical protein
MTEAASAHIEATGHRVVTRECESRWHSHSSSEWCIECGDYIAPVLRADTDGVWDDPTEMELS